MGALLLIPVYQIKSFIHHLSNNVTQQALFVRIPASFYAGDGSAQKSNSPKKSNLVKNVLKNRKRMTHDSLTTLQKILLDAKV